MTAIGWSLSVAAKPTGVPWFEVVGDLSGVCEDQGVGPLMERKSAMFFLSGPRFRTHGKLVQVLAESLGGIAHDDSYRSANAESIRWIWRPSGGVDVRLSTYVSVRFLGGIIPATSKGLPTITQFTSAIVLGTETRAKRSPPPNRPAGRR